MNYSPKDIAKLTEGKLISSCDLKINHVSTDSRSVQNSRSTIFFALKKRSCFISPSIIRRHRQSVL